MAVLVGHGAVRSAVMGYEEKQATAEQITEMEMLVEQGLDEEVSDSPPVWSIYQVGRHQPRSLPHLAES